MSIENELVKLIRDIDKDFGGLYSIAESARRDFLRARAPSIGGDFLMGTKALGGLVDELISQLRNESSALATLRRSPPGWFSSIVDFIYQVSVNPSAPSQKSEYYKKIKETVPNKSKTINTLESVVGIKESTSISTIEEVVKKHISSWKGTLSLHLTEDFVDIVIDKVSDIVSIGVENEKELDYKIKNLSDYVTSNSRGDQNQIISEIKNLLTSLRDELYRIAPTEENRKNILNQFSKINNAFLRISAANIQLQLIFKTANSSTEAYLGILNMYESKFDRYLEGLKDKNKNFLQKVDDVLEKVSPSEKAKSTQMIQTYVNYIQRLYGRDRGSILHTVLRILDQIKKMKDIVSLTSTESVKNEQQSKPNQPVQKDDSKIQQVPSAMKEPEDNMYHNSD